MVGGSGGNGVFRREVFITKLSASPRLPTIPEGCFWGRETSASPETWPEARSQALPTSSPGRRRHLATLQESHALHPTVFQDPAQPGHQGVVRAAHWGRPGLQCHLLSVCGLRSPDRVRGDPKPAEGRRACQQVIAALALVIVLPGHHTPVWVLSLRTPRHPVRQEVSATNAGGLNPEPDLSALPLPSPLPCLFGVRVPVIW